MRLFDPHVHMSARTTDDYQAMKAQGIVAVCEPAFWLGQPRTHVGSYEDYLQSLIGWEHFRASQFGIHHFCAVSLNPREANNSAIAEGVIEILPLYLEKNSVLAIGEIGFDDMTAAEEKYFLIQLELAKLHHMPVIIHTPHRNKKRGMERSIALVKDVGISENMVNIDHNTEETLPIVLESCNCWAGHTIYPKTKMSKLRMLNLVKKYGTDRLIINSSADWGISDPLNVAKTCQLMKENGILQDQLDALFWQNPVAFFEGNPRFNREHLEASIAIDQNQNWQGNTVLRGQQPLVEEEQV